MTAVTAETRYLGVDLAWSGSARSGVCVLDANGRILDDGAVRPEDLVDWVLRWRGSGSVLAIDGPLVVPSDSGPSGRSRSSSTAATAGAMRARSRAARDQ